jgi:hypothetical protein
MNRISKLRSERLIGLLTFAAELTLFFGCTAHSQSPLQKSKDKASAGVTAEFKVVSALRTESWRPYFNGPELKPSDPKDVVLWVRVSGVPSGWHNPKVPLYVKAGEQRCDFMSRSMSSYSNLGPPPPDHAAFLVPRDSLEMTLVLGDLPPKSFRADRRVLDRIDASDPPK